MANSKENENNTEERQSPAALLQNSIFRAPLARASSTQEDNTASNQAQIRPLLQRWDQLHPEAVYRPG